MLKAAALIHLVLVQSKEIVTLEELFGWSLRMLTRHDVHQDFTARSGRFDFRQLLKPSNSLHLDLVKGLFGRQTDVVHALWICNSKTSALSTCKKQNPTLVPRDGLHGGFVVTF